MAGLVTMPAISGQTMDYFTTRAPLLSSGAISQWNRSLPGVVLSIFRGVTWTHHLIADILNLRGNCRPMAICQSWAASPATGCCKRLPAKRPWSHTCPPLVGVTPGRTMLIERSKDVKQTMATP